MDKRVLFLHTNQKVSWGYISLATALNWYDIKTVPVQWDQFMGLSSYESFTHVVVITSNVKEKQAWDRKWRSYLLKMVQSKKINLLHLSSFQQCAMLPPNRSLLYHFWSLPVDTHQIVPIMVEKIQSITQKQDQQVWWNK